MNEVREAFFEEVREKGLLARSARHKHRPDRRPNINKYTNAGWKKMNGTINSFNLSQPMKWAAFKDMPVDMQREYVSRLVREYKVGSSALGEMFGITGVTCSKYINRKLNVTLPTYTSNKLRKKFIESFCRVPGEIEPAKSTEPSVTVEVERPAEQPKQQAAIIHLPPREERLSLNNISLSFSGPFDAQIIADKLSALFDFGHNVKISIEIETLES